MSPCKKAQGSEDPLKACGYISSFLFGLATSSALVVGTAILDHEDEAAPGGGGVQCLGSLFMDASLGSFSVPSTQDSVDRCGEWVPWLSREPSDSHDDMGFQDLALMVSV